MQSNLSILTKLQLPCNLHNPGNKCYNQRVEIWKERAGSFGTVTEKNGRPMPGHTGHNWDKEAVV